MPGNNTTSGADQSSFCRWDTEATLSISEAIILTTVNSVSGTLAIFGNLLVILAVYRTPELHRPTNYLIASLALADLEVGALAIPLWISRIASNVVDDHHILSKLSDVLTVQTLTASTYSLCAVTIERYIAIVSVYGYVRVVTSRRCAAVIVVTWVFSLAVGSIRFAINERSALSKFYLSAALVSIVLPFIVVAFCYIRIFRAAREQTRKIHALAVCVWEIRAKRQRKASRTVALVVGVFILCWTPALVVSLLGIILPICLYRAWLGTVSLSFSNSALNAWIYTARNCHFRQAFRRLLGLQIQHCNAPTRLGMRRRRNAASHERLHVRAWSIHEVEKSKTRKPIKFPSYGKSKTNVQPK